MCKDIESIKNVTIFTDLSSGVDFTQNVIINNQPDECVVRSISYAGDETVDPKGTYLIWSDLINDSGLPRDQYKPSNKNFSQE